MAKHLQTLLILFACLLATTLISSFWSRPKLRGSGCGPRSLYAVVKHYHQKFTEEQVKVLFVFPDNTDISFAELAEAANQIGFSAEGRTLSVPELRQKRPIGILHIDGTHFVAVVGYEGTTVRIVETGLEGELQNQQWLYADLESRWDGKILILTRH